MFGKNTQLNFAVRNGETYETFTYYPEAWNEEGIQIENVDVIMNNDNTFYISYTTMNKVIEFREVQAEQEGEILVNPYN